MKKITIHSSPERIAPWLVVLVLSLISVFCYIFFYRNGLSLAYNDARSHLDIGRRVVEGLKPGIAQLGSVWLPLNHILMIPTIWNDFMWHSGLSGTLQSMVSFVAIGLIIYAFLKKLGVSMFGRLVGVFVFATNLNILYLQSTAMTELLLLSTMTIGVYELLNWHTSGRVQDLIKCAFWIMLASLVRYDGWFLLAFATLLVAIQTIRSRKRRNFGGTTILFATLAGFGIFLWFLWNLLIFKDPLYFIFGPFSAYAQQSQMQVAGVLATKGNLLLSLKVYIYALVDNSGLPVAILGTIGAIVLWTDKKISTSVKMATTALTSSFIFNVLALFLGFSVLFVEGISGKTWFNVRYGVMLMPTFAIFIGYLAGKWRFARWVILAIVVGWSIWMFGKFDAVTIDDARFGSSQTNVSEVSTYLHQNAVNQPGLILISAASHDAIIFSSGLPMKQFVHEGTGIYWLYATTFPDHWVKWIVMRTYDDTDLTYKSIKHSPGFANFQLVAKYPFADVYELKPEYQNQLPSNAAINLLRSQNVH